MKALTICQPYAHLILQPRGQAWHKRVENRSWPLRYRGELVIHAGKSRAWYDEAVLASYGLREHALVFGAIVGVATVVDCIAADRIHQAGRAGAGLAPRLRWLSGHVHVQGPWCIVLANVRRLRTAIPYRGAQGLFEVPGDLFGEADLVAVDG